MSMDNIAQYVIFHDSEKWRLGYHRKVFFYITFILHYLFMSHYLAAFSKMVDLLFYLSGI